MSQRSTSEPKARPASSIQPVVYDRQRTGVIKALTIVGIVGTAIALGVLAGQVVPSHSTTADIQSTSSSSSGSSSAAGTATVLASGKSAASGISENGAVRVEIEPSRVDFGEVQRGTRATATVRVYNRGPRVVTIRDIVTTCGCTVADEPKDPIAPGSHAEVEVRMAVSEKVGHTTTKTMSFLIEGLEKAIKIPVSSTSAEFIAASTIVLDPKVASDPVLELWSTDEHSFHVTEVRPEVLSGARDQASEHHRLMLDREAWRNGTRPRSVRVFTDHPRVPELIIKIGTPVRATTPSSTSGVPHDRAAPLPDSLQVFPRRVSYGTLTVSPEPIDARAPQGAEIVREVLVRGASGLNEKSDAIAVHGEIDAPPGIEARVVGWELENESVLVRVALMAHEALDGPTQAKLRLRIGEETGWFTVYFETIQTQQGCEARHKL